MAEHGEPAPEDQEAGLDLKRLSDDILPSYLDVEGGFLSRGKVVGHSFPTCSEPGSDLKQLLNEATTVRAALQASLRTGRAAQQLLQDGNDVVLVSVIAASEGSLAAWCLRRLINFRDIREFANRLLLVGVMLVALVSIGIVLKLSFNMRRGFAAVEAGLERLRTDAGFRLPAPDHRGVLYDQARTCGVGFSRHTNSV